MLIYTPGFLSTVWVVWGERFLFEMILLNIVHCPGWYSGNQCINEWNGGLPFRCMVKHQPDCCVALRSAHLLWQISIVKFNYLKKIDFCFLQKKKLFHANRKAASSADTYHEKMQHHPDNTNKDKKKRAIPSFFQSQIATSFLYSCLITGYQTQDWLLNVSQYSLKESQDPIWTKSTKVTLLNRNLCVFWK